MKKHLFKLIRISGLPFLFRELIQRNKVTILFYHDINKKTAEKSFRYLSRKYNIIDLNNFIEAIEKKDSSKIPKKALILTFDDGHIGNYEILPIIKRFNLPVTIFLCASIIGTNRNFWFNYNNELIPVQELKKHSNAERLRVLSEYDFYQEKEFDIPQALQKKQINEMKSFINFQSHTMYHPILSGCNEAEARNEIFGSKEILAKEYNIKVSALAYPNGNYSERDVLLTKEAGYRCALTIDFGFNTINTDIFRLKRISVNDTADISELIVKASGAWGFLKKLKIND